MEFAPGHAFIGVVEINENLMGLPSSAAGEFVRYPFEAAYMVAYVEEFLGADNATPRGQRPPNTRAPNRLRGRAESNATSTTHDRGDPSVARATHGAQRSASRVGARGQRFAR